MLERQILIWAFRGDCIVNPDSDFPQWPAILTNEVVIFVLNNLLFFIIVLSNLKIVILVLDNLKIVIYVSNNLNIVILVLKNPLIVVIVFASIINCTHPWLPGDIVSSSSPW